MKLNLNSSTRTWLRATAASASVLLLLQIIRWPLTEWLTVFREPLVEIIAALTFLVIGIGGFMHALRQQKTLGRSAWLPFGLFFSTAVLLAFVPFNALYLKANFLLYQSERTAIAQSILASPEGQRENQAGRGNLITLPPDKQHLSADGGELMVDHRDGKTFILFFTFRGVLDRFSGYVYSSTDDPPAKDEFLGDGIEIKRVAPHWFWYAS